MNATFWGPIVAATIAGLFGLAAADIMRPSHEPVSHDQHPALLPTVRLPMSIAQDITDAEEALASAMNAFKEAADQTADAEERLSNAISTEAEAKELIAATGNQQIEFAARIAELSVRLPLLDARAKKQRALANELWEKSNTEEALVEVESERISRQFEGNNVELQNLFREIGHKRWQNVKTGVTFTTDADPRTFFAGVDEQGYPTDHLEPSQLQLQEQEAYARVNRKAERARQAAQEQDAIADAAQDEWTQLHADRKRLELMLREWDKRLIGYEAELVTSKTRRVAAETKVEAAKTRVDPARMEVDQLERALDQLRGQMTRYTSV